MYGNIILRDNSSLKILGTANVASFKCNYEAGFETDTLSYSTILKDKIGIMKGDTLKLDIDAFECGRRGINRDLRKTLQYNEFPTIDVWLTQFLLNNNIFEELQVSISIAGIQNEYTLKFDVTKFDDYNYQIIGERKINMSDFNLVAPRALMGLVRVHDELTITFNLFIEQS